VFDVMPTKKKSPKSSLTRTAGPSSERAWLDAYLVIANSETSVLERTQSRSDIERAFRHQLELDHAHNTLRAAGRTDDVDGLTWSKASLAWHRSTTPPFDTPPPAWLRALRRTAELVALQRTTFRRQLTEIMGAFANGTTTSLRSHRARANVNLQDVRFEVVGVEIDDDFRLHYDLLYRTRSDAAQHGLLWAFLLDKDRGFGATLRCCAREACAKFYFAQPVAGGGHPSKFCGSECRATNEREKHAAVMRAKRARESR
jgi:hypothetical protein